MLGSIGASKGWLWGAQGKHPVARDYFKAGATAPMIEAFSSWMEKGFHVLGDKKRDSGALCSWRFWARGAKSETLVCGVGRDSCDSVGRPYPLFIMGTGVLRHWDDEWDLLPQACEKTWSRMEYLSAKRFVDFKQLEDEVQLLKRPDSGWAELRSQYGNGGWSAGGGQASLDLETLRRRVTDVAQGPDFVVSLDKGPGHDDYGAACSWHAELKSSNKEAPNAVFIGGTSGKTYLAVFRRALAPTDFVRLWSAGKGLENEAERSPTGLDEESSLTGR